MRREPNAPPAEAGDAPAESAGEREMPASETQPTPEMPPSRTVKPGKLTAMLALEEPARTEALEKAATAGLTVNLRSTTGEEVRWRYGEHILVVPPQPKPFATAHAVHLLFTAPHLVEEVEE